MAEPIATVGDLAGICGHDGTNWEKVLIDASKRLVVAVASVVAQDAQLYGYYDGDWQKAPIPWGYSDAIREAKYNGAAGGGYNVLQSTAVPAGEVHYYTILAMLNVTSAFGPGALKLNHSGADYQFYRFNALSANYTAAPNQPIILEAGDYIKAEFYGCTAGDVLYFTLLGYKMDLDL